MKRSERLKIVETLAKRREDQAASALSDIRAQLQAEHDRLKELSDYRLEYMGYLDEQGGNSISIEQWRRTQGFIDQLADLIVRQEHAVTQWHQREKQVLEKWQILYQRRKNIAQFIDKVSIDEMVIEDKKEQRILDELVSLKLQQH